MKRHYLRPINRHIMTLGTSGKVFRLVVLAIFIASIWYLATCLLPKSINEEKFSGQSVDIIPGKGSISVKEHLVVDVPIVLQLDIFYEALCPDSRHYIIQQISPTFNALKDIIELQLVPYGKASTNVHADGTLTFTCQHGPKECMANKVHACVANRVKDATLALKYVHCMIDINFHAIDPVTAGERCVDTEYWPAVKECSTSEKGDAILHHMGKLTHNLFPRVSFIPTVTVDGNQNQQNMLYKDLKSTLCKLYKGPTPPSCL